MNTSEVAQNKPGTESHRNGRLAFLALLLLVPTPSLGTAAALFWWPQGPLGKTLFVVAKVWMFLLPLAWMLAVDRERPGLSPARRGGLGIGALTGVAIAGIIFAAYAAVRKFGILDPSIISERAAQTGLNQPAFYLGGAVFWVTLNSLMEEYVWRWFVFRKFEVLLGGKAAVVASALGFTTHHVIALAAQFNWPITVLASTGVFIGGAAWSWLYLRFRSIWPCYVSHAIVDMPIFLIGWRLIFGGR